MINVLELSFVQSRRRPKLIGLVTKFLYQRLQVRSGIQDIMILNKKKKSKGGTVYRIKKPKPENEDPISIERAKNFYSPTLFDWT